MKSMSLNCKVLIQVSPGFVRLVPSVLSMVGKSGSPRSVLVSLADLSCGFALAVMSSGAAEQMWNIGQGRGQMAF